MYDSKSESDLVAHVILWPGASHLQLSDRAKVVNIMDLLKRSVEQAKREDQPRRRKAS